MRKYSKTRLTVESLEYRWVPTGYTITNLGSLIEGGSSQASDINASAQVVGWAYAGMGYEHAFIWQNGVMTDLGTLGGDSSRAFGINDAGQVVGHSNLASDWTAYRAFLITPEDTDNDGTADRWFRDSNNDGANDLMRNLGTLGGGSPSSVAWDVNNSGQVVGSSSSWNSQSNVTQAFRWQNGTMSDLGTLGGNYRVARATNDAGQIAGVYSDPFGTSHTVLRTNGVVTDLGPSYGAGATDINDAGQLIDSYSGLPRLWTPTVPNGTTGNFTDLGLLPLLWPDFGGAYSNPLGINNTGEVVGYQTDVYGTEESNGEAYRGFHWKDGVIEVLPVTFAEAINDHGQIVGNSGIGGQLLTPIGLELPRVTIGDVTVTEGNTGTRTATFTVTLSTASSQAVNVNYLTANGTATVGIDYATLSGTLAFASGETTKTISVVIYGDRLAEPNETFVVTLSNPTNATIADGQGIGTIIDDEPRISISDVSKMEGKKGQTTLFTFTISLSAAYDQAVTMSFRTVDGTAKTSNSDYVAKTGTLTFAPGETTKTITIEVKGDSKREANETFYLDLFNNSSNSLFTKRRGIGTILNDD